MSESPEQGENQEPQEPERRFEDRWKRDFAEDIPRTASGGLPIGIVLVALVIFALGFYLFRRWRSQYVDFSEMGSWGEQLTPMLTALGLS